MPFPKLPWRCMAMFKATQVSLLTALITSVLVNGIFYSALRRPDIATVDIVSITSQFIKEEAQKNHSNLEKEAAIKAFSHHLEAALQDLSQSKSLVLLPKEAVIKGSTDYTATLMTMIKLEHKS
ncbi:TPA: hypothetical protein JA337_03590 [Legionella pneumophila]|nr:hypothetical protein [Legionella pneumophila]HAT9146612.1 hypothetical protein [Legionella pneumophila subsp. pneumophila]